ncbi:MAG: hypothetical protein HS119_08955 [Flavobacteriales bacterium]|nr:hypothetical protein [Flavobacteriales bacterium]
MDFSSNSLSKNNPFGSIMPNSDNLDAGEYTYGMNGMMRDNEVKSNGNSYTSYWRQYDPRLGRWMSDEPKPVAWESGYAAFRNNPIYFSDPSGDFPNVGQMVKSVGNFFKNIGQKIGDAFKGKEGKGKGNAVTGGDKFIGHDGGTFDTFEIVAEKPESSSSSKGVGNISISGIISNQIQIVSTVLRFLDPPMGNTPMAKGMDGGYQLIDNYAGFQNYVVRGNPSNNVDVTGLSDAFGSLGQKWFTNPNNQFGASGVETGSQLQSKITEVTQGGISIIEIVNEVSIKNTMNKVAKQLHHQRSPEEIRQDALNQMGLFSAYFNAVGNVVIQRANKKTGIMEVEFFEPETANFEKYKNVASSYER